MKREKIDVEYEDDVFTKDVKKKLTLGDPDGEARYVESLDLKVPTFVDPREDLVVNRPNIKNVKRLDYHVPFQMRGPYKIEDVPEEWGEILSCMELRTTKDGYVICEGTSEGYRRTTQEEKDQGLGTKVWEDARPCTARAVNRTLFCAMHGGALHPADKKMSDKTIVQIPDRVAGLTKVQKVLQGFIKIEELTEEEIKGGFIVDDDGQKKYSRFLGPKIEQAMTKELHVRLNAFLKEKAPDMLKVVVDIATNPIAEEADRLKAAIWAYERVGGRTPEVVVHGKTEAPYEQILGGVQSGSREDYRKTISSDRGEDQSSGVHSDSGSDSSVIDAELVGDDGEDWYGEDYGNSSADGNRENEALDLSQVDYRASIDADEGFYDRHDAGTWNSRQTGISRSGVHAQHVNGRRQNVDRGQREDFSPPEGDNSGSDDDDERRRDGILRSVEERQELSDAAKSLKAARDRVRRRRFAARANGAQSLDRQPYTIEFRPIMSGPLLGKHKVILWKADQLTERLLNKIAKDEYEFSIGEVQERQARVLDREIAAGNAKLAGEDIGRIRKNGW